jgi:Chromo (CHRromatin Organisation MOdifier) domain
MFMRYHWGLAVGHIYSHDSDPLCGSSGDEESSDHLPKDSQVSNVIEEYEVEEIVSSRLKRGQLEYLVHWKGYSQDDDSWEPEEYVKNAADLVQRFHKDNPEAPNSQNRSSNPNINDADQVESDDSQGSDESNMDALEDEEDEEENTIEDDDENEEEYEEDALAL